MSVAVRVLAFVLPLLWSGVSGATIGYQTPFGPEQCDLALAKAQRLRHAGSNDLRARLMRAEALLCRGVQDDPAALDLAITGFERVVAQEPLNFFARLYLAEAVRERFPSSDAARAAFAEAQRALDRADVGAAHPSLAAHIAQSIREITEQLQRSAVAIHDSETAIATGNASPHAVGEWSMLVARTGSAGLERAVVRLDTYAAEHPDPILGFYRAEMLRDRLPKSILGTLYRAAEERLCAEGGDVTDRQTCLLARWRLEQLEGSDLIETGSQ
ncbi:MAG: hypothetical protein ACHQ9S_18655 [Candidatus Binatia bacterium]